MVHSTPGQLQLGLHTGLLCLSAFHLCFPNPRPSFGLLLTIRAISEPSTSLNSHQLRHPSWQPTLVEHIQHGSCPPATVQRYLSAHLGTGLTPPLPFLPLRGPTRADKHLGCACGRGRDKEQVLFHRKTTDKLAEKTDNLDSVMWTVSVQRLS